MNTKLIYAYESLKSNMLNFKNDQRGVTAIEYGLIGMAMAVLVGALLTSDGALILAIEGAYEEMADAINNAGLADADAGAGSSDDTP